MDAGEPVGRPPPEKWEIEVVLVVGGRGSGRGEALPVGGAPIVGPGGEEVALRAVGLVEDVGDALVSRIRVEVHVSRGQEQNGGVREPVLLVVCRRREPQDAEERGRDERDTGDRADRRGCSRHGAQRIAGREPAGEPESAGECGRPPQQDRCGEHEPQPEQRLGEDVDERGFFDRPQYEGDEHDHRADDHGPGESPDPDAATTAECDDRVLPSGLQRGEQCRPDTDEQGGGDDQECEIPGPVDLGTGVECPDQ